MYSIFHIFFHCEGIVIRVKYIILSFFYKLEMQYIKPSVFSQSFTCPHCGINTQQNWWMTSFDNHFWNDKSLNEIRVAICFVCKKHSLWIVDNMIYPDTGSSPIPNPNMPLKVKKLYLEAASIHAKSPRGAAALLRMAVQQLCIELGEKGESINDDIASLVKKGLPSLVQKSLDVVRVVGNDAVHPGQIDTDDPEIVMQLFDLVNVIIEYTVSLPQRVSGIYSSLPKEKVAGIINRDK